MYSKVADNVYLIDSGMSDVIGVSASYLIKAGKTCLIDGGTREGSKSMIKSLKEIDAFPPDIIILTHSHWDHVQAVPILREQAKKEGKEIEVFASHKAIPLLEDQSFNNVFDKKAKYENISNVKPVKEGDIIDLDEITLQIIDAPGHIDDHITIFDQTSKILYPGDSLGAHIVSGFPFPTFMPPFWNKESYFSSIDKMEEINFEGIAFAHYGFLKGKEAQEYISNLRTVSKQWLSILEKVEKEGRLDDVPYLIETIFKETDLNIELMTKADLQLVKQSAKFLVALINPLRKILGKEPIVVANVLFSDFIEWTVHGYKMYKDSVT
jgi:glyoxylase-like metal-dependent hydrolase (beta-lactamase superfamily II)